jgi:two-component system chemotaxis response regulator CheB
MIDAMPRAAMALTQVDHVMKVDQIVNFLKELNRQYK